MWAHVLLTTSRASAAEAEMLKKKGLSAARQLQSGEVQAKSRPFARLSVTEIRRLFWRLVLVVQHSAQYVLSWSRWRRHHQAIAKYHHDKSRDELLNCLQL